MQANAYSQYALKDLHQAIDLMDRKITYCNTLEAFESEAAREAHFRKLSSKRTALVKSAMTLAAMGVHCDPKFLPRSFIHIAPEEANSVAAGAAVAQAAGTEKSPSSRRKRR
ncbi:MAG: hypothetical protein WA294_10850 [Acidobacteriaceae bacterium]